MSGPACHLGGILPRRDGPHNVGKVADYQVQQAHAHEPGLAKFNDRIFGKVSRAAMLQTALTNYGRNRRQLPRW